ncbi:protein Asterix-like [Acanthaster planci]|uniref:Protein Asterix-like n=1 Tax=Acanthaster planci TaxID=133434 RepID=A0A8B7ZYB2_ACAPL|nr:protein Asterix-like [Acanthaster planci]
MSSSQNNSSEVKRPNKIVRYKAPEEVTPDDPTADYMNLLGMVFSMLGLMMKMKWCAWIAVFCSFISFSNTRCTEDGKQMFSSFMLSISAVVMSYLQNPQPMTLPWQ